MRFTFVHPTQIIGEKSTKDLRMCYITPFATFRQAKDFSTFGSPYEA